MSRQWTVELTVDEVVVEGVPVGDVEAFRTGLSTVLGELATVHAAALAGPTARPAPAAPPPGAPLSTQVAHAVWHRVSGGGPR
jgi:hypothetical protein